MDVNKAKGYLALKSGDHARLVLSAPVLRTANKKTLTPELEWKPSHDILHVFFLLFFFFFLSYVRS